MRYANGSAKVKSGHFLFFGGSSPTPEPGSVVTVPVTPEPHPLKVTQFLRTLAQVLASTAAIPLGRNQTVIP